MAKLTILIITTTQTGETVNPQTALCRTTLTKTITPEGLVGLNLNSH